MRSFFRNHREKIFLAVLITIGGFLRLYRFRQTMQFFGDQGRDAIIAKEILIDNNFTLIGPVTSIGNMYLGPFYYYFMTPWLALTYPDPSGPAIAIAVIGILTIALIYSITKKMFSSTAAVIASILYTFSSVVVSHTRFSWNPNLAPIIGLLIIYCLYQSYIKKKSSFIFWSFLLFGIISQLHYISLLILPTILIISFLSFKQSKHKDQVIKFSLLGLVTLLLLSLPLIFFDIRHDFINFNAFIDFMTSPQEHIRPLAKLSRTIVDLQGIAFRIFAQILVKPHMISDRFLTLLYLVGIYWLFITLKKATARKSLLIILFSIGFTILGLSFYTSPIFDHYLGFLYPAVFILIGLILASFWHRHFVGKLFVILLSSWLIYANLQKNPFLSSVGVNIDDIKTAAALISQNTLPPSKYNIALLSHTRDYKAMNYRYFLDTTDHPPQSPDNYGGLDELYIISEPPHQEDPLSSEAFEIQYPNLATVETIIPGPNNIKIIKVTK